jgi:hypothetical protein
MSLEQFLAWEERQPLRYEFDGFQPVAMTGGTVQLDVTVLALYCRRAPGALCHRGLSPGQGARGDACAYLWICPPPGDCMALVVVPRLMARLRQESHTAPLGEAVWPGYRPAGAWPTATSGLAESLDGFPGENAKFCTVALPQCV